MASGTSNCIPVWVGCNYLSLPYKPFKHWSRPYPVIPVPGDALAPNGTGSLITRTPSQYPKRRLSVRSRKVSKPRDLYLELSDRSEIWQALRQQCCRCACQISKRYDNLKYQSRGFETLRDLTKRRLFGYWDGAQSAGNKVTHIFSVSFAVNDFKYDSIEKTTLFETTDKISRNITALRMSNT